MKTGLFKPFEATILNRLFSFSYTKHSLADQLIVLIQSLLSITLLP